MSPQVSELLQTIINFLPIAALIWNAAKMKSQIEILEKEVDRLEKAQAEETRATDKDISMLTSMLNDIKIAVTRIETKLEAKRDIQGKTDRGA